MLTTLVINSSLATFFLSLFVWFSCLWNFLFLNRVNYTGSKFVATAMQWLRPPHTELERESIEWFKGFPAVVWFGSSPTLSSLSRQKARPATKLEKERQLSARRGGEGAAEEPNHTTARKLGPLWIIQELFDGKNRKPNILFYTLRCYIYCTQHVESTLLTLKNYLKFFFYYLSVYYISVSGMFLGERNYLKFCSM